MCEESAQENVSKILCKTRFSLYVRTSTFYGASHTNFTLTRDRLIKTNYGNA